MGKGLAFSLTALLVFGAVARANRALPIFRPPPPPVKVQVTIEASSYGQETRLLIPRKMLGKLATAKWTSVYWTGLTPFAAGIGLALFLAPCGLWLVRRSPASALGLAILLAGGFFLALDNPGQAHPPMVTPAIPNFKLTGNVQVEVVDSGDAIQLILNKNQPYPTKYGQ